MSYIKSCKHANSALNLTVTVAMTGVTLLPATMYAEEVAQQQAPLPAVHVSATVSGYKADEASSPKYTQPLLDTPQTISIITTQVMAQQGVTTLTEALRNSPGVGTFYLGENGSTSVGDAIYMRGFDSSSAIFVDDVRDLGSISRDMFNISQVEVLKGAAGTDSGRGTPTGSINLVSKQPELKEAFSSSLTYGSWQKKRATIDWNKLIDADSGTAMRLNLMKQDSGAPGRHQVKKNRSGIASSLIFGLNSPTRVQIDYLHMEQDNVPDGGVPTIGLPGYSAPTPGLAYLSGAARVSPSNFYGLASDYDKSHSNMLTVRLDHDISPGLTLRNTTRYGKTRQDFLLTSFMGRASELQTAGDPSNWTIARFLPTRKDQRNEILSNQTNITGVLSTGTLKHTWLAGVELTQEKQHALSFTRSGELPPANLYQPNPYDPVSDSYRLNTTGFNDGKTRTMSAYLFDTLAFNERWSLTAGARIDHYHTSYYANAAGVVSKLSTGGNLSNWKLAGSYKPSENSSIYLLQATSLQPPGSANFVLSANASSASNADYAPQKTHTTELGAKWDLLDSKLALNTAVYRTVVSNEVELDATTLQYVQTGKKQVQGIELGITGALTPHWELTTGYALMNTRVVSGAAVSADGAGTLSYAPRQALTSWSTYRLPHGWTIGAGAQYVSAMLRGKSSAVGTPQMTNAYWVFDGMVSYVINKNLDLQFNLSNIFNNEYVASINRSGYRYQPGSARAVSLTANITY